MSVLERDLDAPYERISEDRAAISPLPASSPTADLGGQQPASAAAPRPSDPPSSTASTRVPPRGHHCTEGRHRKYAPAVIAFELSIVDEQRVLVGPYVAAACADHRRDLERAIRSRSERLARGGLTAVAEPIE